MLKYYYKVNVRISWKRTMIERGDAYIPTAKTAQRVPMTVLRFFLSSINSNTRTVTAIKETRTNIKSFMTFICQKITNKRNIHKSVH